MSKPDRSFSRNRKQAETAFLITAVTETPNYKWFRRGNLNRVFVGL